MADLPAGEAPAAADLRTRLVAAAGGAVITGMLRTCRVSERGKRNFQQFHEQAKPVVFALWHGRLLPCSFWNGYQRLVTLVSQHKDGEYIARIVESWGYTVVRGSSSRRGAGALRDLVRHVRAGRSLAITPDGPRGPREVMKPGALLAAQLSGAPVIPASAGASRAWWFGGWDRFLIPQPFSRVRIAYGEPVWVPRDADERRLAEIAREVEDRLKALTRLVDSEEEWARG